MNCTPDECEYCWPWGDGVPGKTRCCHPPVTEHYHESRGWRFSTTLGGPCVIAREIERGEQGSLFDLATTDPEG